MFYLINVLLVNNVEAWVTIGIKLIDWYNAANSTRLLHRLDSLIIRGCLSVKINQHVRQKFYTLISVLTSRSRGFGSGNNIFAFKRNNR